MTRLEVYLIRTIRHYLFTIPANTPQDVTIDISPVDPNRAMILLQGAGYKEGGPTTAPYAAINFPYLVSLDSTNLIINFPFINKEAAICGCSIIEYI
jgi:hypothetical protein